MADGFIKGLKEGFVDRGTEAWDRAAERGQKLGERVGGAVGNTLGDITGAGAKVIKKPFNLTGKVLKFGAIAGAVAAAAMILPSMSFGKKKGGANAVTDGARDAMNAEPQVLTAEQSLQLPPLQLQMPEPPMMPGMPNAAMGGDGASLMDQSPINAARVAQLGASRMGGNYAGGIAAQKEMSALPALP